MNTVTASFDTAVRQMTKRSQWSKWLKGLCSKKGPVDIFNVFKYVLSTVWVSKESKCLMLCRRLSRWLSLAS